jgi:hypothetical protein
MDAVSCFESENPGMTRAASLNRSPSGEAVRYRHHRHIHCSEDRMKTSTRWFWLLVSFLLLLSSSPLSAQQFSPTEDLNMTPEKTTEVLKVHWTFLRDVTEQFFKSIEKRGEFETSDEFLIRVEQEKVAYNGKVDGYIKDNKINKRMFGILMKANLRSYDANAGVYEVTCTTPVELPYDIPKLFCTVPPSSLVGLKDTTQGGYRMSKLFLKFDPAFRWAVNRKVAVEAKANEGSMFFKLRFVLDLTQKNITDKALIRIIPVDVRLVDQNLRKQYWMQTLR